MGVVFVEGEEAVLEVSLGRPVVTNGDFATRLFPNYFGQDLLDFSLLLSVSCQVHGRPRLS